MTLGTLFSAKAAEAIGWALIHQLWQGVVIALLAAATLRLMRNQSARARYAVACLALISMIAFPLVTGWRAWESARFETSVFSNTAPSPIVVSTGGLALSGPTTTTTEIPAAWKLRAVETLRPMLPWLVIAWLAGVGFLSIRLGVMWLKVQLWCRRAEIAPEHWQEKLWRLSRRMELWRPIRLVESASVEVPMVIGWLRPVVLVPMTALTGLSSQQLETILAHELAHIRRHDYLINFLQTCVETLLFYHPGVWWLSNRIRIEREHCCDDIAVEVCGNPMLYARALTNLEGLRSAPMQPALAADGGSLRERILRLVSTPKGRCSYRWVTGVSILSLIVVFAVVAPLSILAYSTDDPTPAKKGERTSATSPSISVDVIAPDSDQEESEDSEDSEDTEWNDDEDSDAEIADGTDWDLDFEIAPLPPTPPSDVVATIPSIAPTPRPSARVANAMAASFAFAFAQEGKSDRKATKLDGELSVDDLIELRNAGVTAEYIARMRAAGYGGLTLEELVDLRHQGVSPEYISMMNSLGFGKLSAEKLAELRAHGVTPAYIESVKSFGFTNLSLDRVIEFRIHGVTSEFVKEMRDLGYTNLPAEQLVELRIHGVSSDYVKKLRAAGYNLPLKKIVEWRTHGVTPEYAQQMKDAGFAKISADDLVQLRIHGVSIQYIAQMAAAGYKNLDLDELMQMRIHGVDEKFIQSLRAAGLIKLTAEELIKLRISGVDADFIREMKSLKNSQ